MLKTSEPGPGRWRTPALDQRIAVSVVYVGALFMNIMDVTIVNVALPTLGRQFHVAAASVDVVVIAYLVSLAVFIPASGWIGDRFGGRRTLLAAIGVFTVASALCGLSNSLTALVVFRIFQGIGGGMLTPIGMAMLYRTFPPSERVHLASVLMLPTAFAPALGPVLGGLLVTDLSWRWVFLVNLPIGAAAIGFGLAFVTEQRQERPGRFDLAGFALAGLGFGSLMYGLSEGPQRGWGSPLIVALIGLGLALSAALVLTELRVREPMIDLRLLRDRMFRVANILVVITMTAFFGVLFLVPLYYQDGRGLSALSSGLSTFPEALGVMIGAQVVSRVLYPAVGPRRLMAVGLAGVSLFTALMATAGGHTSLWEMRLLMFGLGYSIPHVMVCLQAAAFSTISPESTGRASMLFNAQRQLGAAVGVAVLSTVLAAVGPFRGSSGHQVPHFAAYHAAFVTAAAIALVGSLVALLVVHDADALATMPGRRTPGRRRAGRGASVPATGGSSLAPGGVVPESGDDHVDGVPGVTTQRVAGVSVGSPRPKNAHGV
jgi:EmrB/QacA subfamily drug resistance transporter